MHGTTYLRGVPLSVCLAISLGLASPAHAIPPFARRYEVTCSACHQGHYPRLNAYGRQFRDNGYQLPDGAEQPARSRRSVEPGLPDEGLSIFKEIPLSLRGQVFTTAEVQPSAPEEPLLSNSLFSYITGGGSVAEDVSYFFTWTPFPDPSLHQARIGFHNLLPRALGPGTLNLRAGALFLLDFQRPGHRFLSPGAVRITSLTVGDNAFSFAETALGVQAYGRPAWGPVHYEVALVAGDPPGQGDQDDWKDGFARLSATAWQNTSHAVTPAVFAYKGRSDKLVPLGDVTYGQRDDFWIAGGDLEIDVGPVNLFGMGFASRHSEPIAGGAPVSWAALRAEALIVPHPKWVASLRYERSMSADDPTLRVHAIAPHLTYLIHNNVLVTAAWRHDLADFNDSDAVLVLDTAF